ncbi:krimper [Musca autumnalis]|uniref:krimper n=1 Tax=Musca autumnalis TaxID=221902 RepID=UPI003CF34FFD
MANSMEERLEQLMQLHKMCLQELFQLQNNVQDYLKSSTNMVRIVESNWEQVERGGSLALMIYDNFLTSITNVMNLARKFNLQLQINQGEDTNQIYDLFGIKPTQAKEEINSTKYHTNNVKEEIKDYFSENNGMKRIDFIQNYKKSIYPAEEVSNIDDHCGSEFVYPKENLRNNYSIGNNIQGFVTYLKDVDSLEFYIFDFQSRYVGIINEVAHSLDLRQYHDLPPAHEVFGLVLDKRILRAVRSKKMLYDQELEEQVYPCYLLDFGEIEHMKVDDIKYRLSKEQQQVPAMGILCEMKKVPIEGNLKDKLKQLEYKQCDLKIVGIEEDRLVVEFTTDNELETSTTNLNALQIDTNPFRQAKPVAAAKETTPKELSKEELEILYNDPLMCTSNALTAVMGYNPKDEKRLCRFYDPKTGACFKGSTCKQDHEPTVPEVWTKDVIPAVSFVDNRTPVVVYPKGAIINITPTHIGQICSFYVQINDVHHNNTPLIWNDEDIPVWKRMERPPQIYELVLARYDDGNWYRAKIISHDDDYQMFKVFYVDYGNLQVVHIRNLAKCDTGVAQRPFQAILCRLGNLQEIQMPAAEKKSAIQKLCAAILNQSLDVKVISHHEDLIVSFVDEAHLCLIDWLAVEGFVRIQ